MEEKAEEREYTAHVGFTLYRLECSALQWPRSIACFIPCTWRTRPGCSSTIRVYMEVKRTCPSCRCIYIRAALSIPYCVKVRAYPYIYGSNWIEIQSTRGAHCSSCGRWSSILSISLSPENFKASFHCFEDFAHAHITARCAQNNKDDKQNAQAYDPQYCWWYLELPVRNNSRCWRCLFFFFCLINVI